MGAVDAIIARIAATQNGRVTRKQLLAAGVTSDAIKHRLKTGRLHIVHRGTYAVGHLATDLRARARQALLAFDGLVFISHWWAAAFWGLMPWPDGPVHVTVAKPTARARKHGDIVVLRTTLLDPRDFTERLGLPITTPERTILDLAERLSDWELQALIADAMVRKLVTVHSLMAIVNRAGRRHGVAKLRRALTESPGLTRSEYERLLVRICRAAKLPQPIMNAKLHGYEVDAYFAEYGVVVEVNPFSTHGHKRAHDNDTRKLTDLAARGYIVLGFTDKQLKEQPLYVVAKIQEALAQSSSSTAGAFARRTSASMPLAGSGREK